MAIVELRPGFLGQPPTRLLSSAFASSSASPFGYDKVSGLYGGETRGEGALGQVFVLEPTRRAPQNTFAQLLRVIHADLRQLNDLLRDSFVRGDCELAPTPVGRVPDLTTCFSRMGAYFSLIAGKDPSDIDD